MHASCSLLQINSFVHVHLEGIMFNCTINTAPYIVHLHLRTYYFYTICIYCTYVGNAYLIDCMGMQVHWHKTVLGYACTVHVCAIHGYLFLEYTSVCLFRSPPWSRLYLCIHVPLSPCFHIGLQSQSETENAANTRRSLPSDDDNDNLPLVLQREVSLKVKEEWSLFVINDQREETQSHRV